MTTYTIELTKNYQNGSQEIEIIEDITDRHEGDVKTDYEMLAAMKKDMFSSIESCHSEITSAFTCD